MKERITVVLEYDRREDLPRISKNSIGSDLGKGRVCAIQFSDALQELEVLDRHADDDVRKRAYHAAMRTSESPMVAGS